MDKKKRLAKLGGTLFVLIGLLNVNNVSFSDIPSFLGGFVFFMAIGLWMLWVGFKKEKTSQENNKEKDEK